MMRACVALAALACVAASCHRSAHDRELAARIAQLEARVAAQNAALAKQLEELAEKLDAIDGQLRAQSSARLPVKRRTPDPAVTYSVPLRGSPTLGLPTAKVTIVMAYEFACRFCRRAWDTIDELRKKYGADLRVVYKQYVVHRTALPAAYAACAAERQGRWREMADLLWAKAFATGKFEQAHIDALATELGLDMKQYGAYVAGPCPQELVADQALLRKLAASGTPTFWINGRYLSGAKPAAVFEQLIDEELAKATAAIKAGVQPERFYEQEIVGKGVAEVPMP